jgi:hypothetical protein
LASIFPGSPSLNDVFTSNGTTWQWNGEAWTVVASDGQTFTNVITSPSSQTITADSPTDTLTIAAGTNISVSGNSSNDTLTISSTIDTQNLINTASAAAYTSASGYTNFIVDGLDTLDIEENTNLYFTNQRAIDATSSLITSASANALSQANTYSNSASANVLAQANSYTNSASASLVAYTNSASASLIAYTDQEVSALQLFSNISTSPSTQLITGDSNSDTLTLVSGSNIYINSDSSTDSITIGVTGIQEQIDNLITSIGPSSASATASRITAYVKNGSTALAKGVPVYVTGADGTNIIVGPSSNIAESTSSKTIGFTQTALNANQHGYIVLEGTLGGLNTDLATAGDPIWLGSASGTVIYGLANKPQAPNHLVYLGVVSRANSSNGEIFVKIQNGFELKELHDVRINGVANDDLIVYNSASSIWVNSPKQNIITTASAAAYASASAYTDSEINALTTTDIEEGTSLYFTNERAVNAGSATYILQTSQQGIINSASAAAVTAVIDGAPGALDTLNELAAALGDDQNFATSVTNSLSGKLDISTASTTYLTQAAYASASPNFATDAELASAIVTASAAAVAYADGLTTTDIAEGTSLYYTNARGQQTASTMFVHGNHTNVSAQYVSGEIRLTSSAAGGGGGATVAYQTTQPDTSALDAGSLWIDSDQDAISGLLPATFTRWVKVLSASATTISGLDDNVLSLLYTPGYEKVFINGTLLVRGSDYTATTGNTIVLPIPAEATDVIEIHSYESFQIADTYTQAAADAKFFPINASRVDRWTKTYSASASTITGVDNYSQSLLYTSGLESVYINGVLVDPSEYTRTSASVITPTEAILSGDVVDIITPKAFEVANTYTQAQIDAKYNNRTRWTKTYSASAVVITGNDDSALPLSYTSGFEEVYLNGILLTPVIDYARTSASVVTLGQAVVTSDVVEIVSTQPFNVASTYTIAQANSTFLTQSSASTTYAPVAAGGLVLINKTDFTSATTININNCFSSTYENYRILLNFSSFTGGNDLLNFRWGTSGTINTTSNYYRAVWRIEPNSGTVTNVNGSSPVNTMFISELKGDSASYEINIFNPFATAKTYMTATGVDNSRSGSISNGFFNTTQSFTDISIFPDGAGRAMTGSISIYGYRK